MSKKNSKTKQAPAKASGVAKPAKVSRPKAAKTKRIGALGAAAGVLKKAGKPMRCPELIKVMAEQKLWSSPNGKTPEATLYAAIIREIRDEGSKARFKKVDRGLFAANA